MRRSRRARTARRPLPQSRPPRRAMPPTPAPVRASALDRDRVRPSTSVPGAVTDGPESSAAPVPFAAMPVVAPAVLPLASTPGVAPLPAAAADTVGHPSASFGSTWQSVSSPVPTSAVGATETGAVLRVVVVVVVLVVVVDDGGLAASPPSSCCALRPQLPLLSSSRSASLPQPLLPSRSASKPPVQPGLSAPPLLIPSGSECDRPWVWPVAVKQAAVAEFTPCVPLAPAGGAAAKRPRASRAPAPVAPIRAVVIVRILKLLL